MLKRRIKKSSKLKSLEGSLKVALREFSCDGDRLLRQVATDLYESLNTPVSLSCEILLRYGDLPQLVGKTVRAESYNSPTSFADDYQAVSFLKKAPFSHEGLDPRSTAVSKFETAEEQCRDTNQRIRSLLSAPEMVSSDVRSALCIASRKIQQVLGVFDSREWLHSCRFGPGAFNHPGTRGLTSVYDKLQVTPSVSPDLKGMGAMLVMSSPPWARSLTGIEDEGFWPFIRDDDLITIPGNRVTFVPKTATTDRAIAIEPLVNIYAQLGLGKMIRRRLRKFGIDLDTQSSNQTLAYWGSIGGNLATIDLSSASDTVAKELVRFLLPERWHTILDMCRSKVGTLGKRSIRYEKFSSMGNGFTFELETLIFWSLSLAACEVAGIDPSGVLAYGDDIVVPCDAYDHVKDVLTFCGFSFNKDKSFKEGVFRESCGKDYYDGMDVRPLFVKELPSKADSLFGLANSLRRLADVRGCSNYSDGRLRRPWERVLSSLPPVISQNVAVPAHAGDRDGLIRNWDEAQRSPFVLPLPGGWDGFQSARLQATPIRSRKVSNFLGAVASQLYRLEDGDQIDDYIPEKLFNFEQPENRIDEFPSVFPRQGREFVWSLQSSAYYGRWTNLKPFVKTK